MMKIANPIAVLGEDAACELLRKKNYTILERNFRKSYGEIDIIALDGGTLVFVEVKARTNVSYGTPFDSISSAKLSQIVKGAQYYKYVLHPDLPDVMRIDAIGVIIVGKKVVSIDHMTNVTGL